MDERQVAQRIDINNINSSSVFTAIVVRNGKKESNLLLKWCYERVKWTGSGLLSLLNANLCTIQTRMLMTMQSDMYGNDISFERRTNVTICGIFNSNQLLTKLQNCVCLYRKKEEKQKRKIIFFNSDRDPFVILIRKKKCNETKRNRASNFIKITCHVGPEHFSR